MSDYFEALKNARIQAEKSPEGSTRAIATRYWPHIKPNGSINPCPGCQKKSKCSVFTMSGTELIKCHSTSCELNKTRGALELIRWHEDLKFADACDRICEYAGVGIPQKSDYFGKNSNQTSNHKGGNQ